MPRELLRRVWHALRRTRFDADLAEEMTFHREMKQRALEQAGVDPRHATVAADRAFGSGALAANHARDVWVWPWLQDLARDFRLAFRLLAKDWRFTALAATVLGLGIGITNMQAVLVNAICVRGLPIPDVARVVYVAARDAHDREQPLSYREFQTIRAAAPGLSDAAAFATSRVVVGDEGLAPERALVVYLSASAFSIIGVSPALGRAFGPDDDRPGAPPVAVLAHAFWLSRYAGDPAIVGRTVRIDGVPTTVVGVMADGFRFPAVTEVWQPLALMPGTTTTKRDARTVSMIGHLADRRTLADLSGQLASVTAQLAHDYPATNTAIRVTGVPINDRYNGRITDPVWIAFMSVGVLVLLIACANAANLLLMRAAKRGHEMAVRAALGASRAQLARQLLIESTVLAVLGGAVGVGLSLASVRAIESITPPNTLAYWITFTMDGRLLALLCAICLGTVFVFGLAPALHVSKVDVSTFVKDGARGAGGSVRARRWTTAFLTAEFGLTTVMVFALVLGWRQTSAAVRAAAVIDPDRVITAGVTLSSPRYTSPAEKQSFYDMVGERVSADRDVSSIAFATNLPAAGAASRQTFFDGRAPIGGDPPPASWMVSIAGDYFDVLGLRLVRGRTFDNRDGLPGSETAIVNSRFADMFFANGDAIGHRVKLTDPSAPDAPAAWLTIVGVSPTVRQRPFPEPDPVVYVPMRAAPPASAMLLVRVKSDRSRLGPRLRAAVSGVDPNMPLDRLMSMEQAMALAQWNGRVSNDILNGIGFVALLLAAIGVYAVASSGVAQRTHEIGVRLALGAQRSHIAGTVLRRAGAQLAWGLLAGGGCVFLWTRLISDLTPRGLSGLTDLATVVAVMTLIVVAACLEPVRRATRLDPVVALRHE
jgi:putative ABC transport system permease protein